MVSRVVGLVGTLLIVRYPDPDDYGVVSAASVLVATANQFTTLGIGIYLIAHRDAGREAAFHATFLHLALGATERGTHYLTQFPGWGGKLLFLACSGAVFMAGAKILDCLRYEQAAKQPPEA